MLDGDTDWDVGMIDISTAGGSVDMLVGGA